MGEVVLIYGKSGSGKSRSMKHFKSDEILLVNIEKKMLPFRGSFKYVCESSEIPKICAWLHKMPMKAAVIDDAGYLLTNIFMTGHREKQGSAVYDLYNDIADQFWSLLRFIKDKLPKDVIVYILMHEDTNDYGAVKLRTIGKLLDEKVCIEGMVTVCLRCISENGRHYFRTVTNGKDITKSPEEMFPAEEIENDLKAVDIAIREYYNMGGNEQ